MASEAARVGVAAGVGLVLVGGLGWMVRPEAPPDPAPTVRTSASAPDRRVVALDRDCPPAPLSSEARALDATLQHLQRRETLLTGQLDVETGLPLPLPKSSERPDAVFAWLDAHAGAAEVDIDCSAHPCRGTVFWPAAELAELVSLVEAKNALRDALSADYPAARKTDYMRPDGSGLGVKLVFVESVETEGQQRRVEWLLDGTPIPP